MTTPNAASPELQALVRAEWPKLNRFFRSKTVEPDCYDLVHQTFVAFLEKSGTQTLERPRHYLWGIARLQLLKYLEKKRPAASFDSSIHAVGSFATSLGAKLDRRQKLLEALRLLPVDQQSAFELRYGEELSLEETAEALGVSLATVKRYLARALETLRTAHGGDEEAATAEATQAYRAG